MKRIVVLRYPEDNGYGLGDGPNIERIGFVADGWVLNKQNNTLTIYRSGGKDEPDTKVVTYTSWVAVFDEDAMEESKRQYNEQIENRAEAGPEAAQV